LKGRGVAIDRLDSRGWWDGEGLLNWNSEGMWISWSWLDIQQENAGSQIQPEL